MVATQLNPKAELDRRVILYGNIWLWAKAIELQRGRLLAASLPKAERLADAAFFATALLRFEQSVKRAIKETGSDDLGTSWKRYKDAVPHTQIIRDVTNYLVEYSLATGRRQRKPPVAEDWDLSLVEGNNDTIIKIGENHQLSVTKAADAARELLESAWKPLKAV